MSGTWDVCQGKLPAPSGTSPIETVWATNNKALGVGILKPVGSQVMAACDPDPRDGATEFSFFVLFLLSFVSIPPFYGPNTSLLKQECVLCAIVIWTYVTFFGFYLAQLRVYL